MAYDAAMKWIPSLLLAALPCAALVQEPAPDAPRAIVGAVAPTARLNDHAGKLVSLGGAAEGWTILAFYPKAATPGCTKEMCSLRDSAAELQELGASVYGVSRDCVEELAKFAKDQELNFPLLSDPDGSLTRKLEVDMEGRPVAKRITVVLDPKGVIRARDEAVKVDAHGRDMVSLLKRLQAE